MDRDEEKVALRLYVCGRPAVEYGTYVVRDRDLPARQGRRFWAYMVVNHRRAVGRDELMEAIWGDEIPDSWDTVMSAVASRLRAVLRPFAGAGLSIESAPGCYILRLPVDVFIDYERAREAIHAADAAARRSDQTVALAEARVAMEIAARGFLPGEEAPWILRERSLLHEIQIRAAERTVQGELARGHPDLAEDEARLLVRLDPLRESGYRLLMQALVAAGNRGALADVMETCRTTLRDLGGMVPSAETEAVFTELTRR